MTAETLEGTLADINQAKGFIERGYKSQEPAMVTAGSMSLMLVGQRLALERNLSELTQGRIGLTREELEVVRQELAKPVQLDPV